MLAATPDAKALIGDKGYDANWLRQALQELSIGPSFALSPIRKPKFNSTRFSIKVATKSRICLESSKIGGASTRAMTVCAHAFMSAIAIAAIMIFCINQ